MSESGKSKGAAGDGGGDGAAAAGGRPAWHKVHLWQIQPLRDALVIAVVIALFSLGKALSLVTVPMLLALLLAYLFEPVVEWVSSRYRRVSRSGAVALIIASAIVVIGGPIVLGLGLGAAQGFSYAKDLGMNVTRVVTYAAAPEALSRYIPAPESREAAPVNAEPEAAAEPPPEPSPEEMAQIESAIRAYDVLPSESWRDIADWARKHASTPDGNWILAFVRENSQRLTSLTIGTGTNVVRAVVGTAKSLGLVGFGGFLTVFFFYFFSTSYPKVVSFGEKLIPTKKKERVYYLLRRMDGVVAGFVRGRLTICAIQCVYFTVGYFIIGAKAPLLLGIGVGILSIVPYLGLLGVPVSLAVLWLDPPTGFRGAWWWITFAPMVLYYFGQALDDYVLTPMIQGKRTQMDTPTILFASLAGGILAGVYGLLIAIPVAACLKILIQEVLWPRVRLWAQGKAPDVLPISEKPKAG